jgi:hypothetical protein
MDLFVVPTIGFDLLYGFVIVRLDRRDLVWINVTANPTAEWIAESGASAWIISSSWVRRICAESCDPFLPITTTSERTGHCIKMPRSLARFSGPEASNRTPSLAHFVTTRCVFRFSVHSGALKCIYSGRNHPETQKFAFSSATCDEWDTMHFANIVGPEIMR